MTEQAKFRIRVVCNVIGTGHVTVHGKISPEHAMCQGILHLKIRILGLKARMEFAEKYGVEPHGAKFFVEMRTKGAREECSILAKFGNYNMGRKLRHR